MFLATETAWIEVLPAALIVAVVMVGVGLLTRSLAERGADGRLARNGIAGIRTKATQSSDEAWLAAHRVGLGPTRRGGEAFVASAVLSVVPGLAMAATGVGSPGALLIWWLTGHGALGERRFSVLAATSMSTVRPSALSRFASSSAAFSSAAVVTRIPTAPMPSAILA